MLSLGQMCPRFGGYRVRLALQCGVFAFVPSCTCSDSAGGHTTSGAADTSHATGLSSGAAETTFGGESTGDAPPTDQPWTGDEAGCGDGQPQAGRLCFQRVAGPQGQPLLVADFDSDGHLDLLTRELALWLGTGSGGFKASSGVKGSAGWPNGAAVGGVGDFDGVGGPDLLLAGNNTIAVLPNQGTASFGPPVETQVATVDLLDQVRAIAITAEESSVLDVLGTSSTTRQPALVHLVNDGSGGFSEGDAVLSRAQFGSCSIVASTSVDNVSGAPDGVAVLGNACGGGSDSTAALWTVRPSPAGGLVADAGPTLAGGASHLVSGDLDGDEVSDLVVWDTELNRADFFVAGADDRFSFELAAEAELVCPGCPCVGCGIPTGSLLLAPDLDGDRLADVVFVDGFALVGLAVLDEARWGWLDAVPLAFGDFNEDGIDDLIVVSNGSMDLLLSNP